MTSRASDILTRYQHNNYPRGASYPASDYFHLEESPFQNLRMPSDQRQPTILMKKNILNNEQPRRLIYNQCDDSILIHARFLSVECCDEIIRLCEAWNQWENDDDAVYAQATYDMEVEKNLALVDYLRGIGLVCAVDHRYEWHYLKTINSFDDVFVVKYQADCCKAELVDHIDAGDISFMIALSDPNDYEGGGTYFRVSDSICHLNKGDMITFDAKLYHRGVKITRGVRYVLVGFCFTDSVEANSQCPRRVLRGNTSIDFTSIPRDAT